jgi:hypothetical protein
MSDIVCFIFRCAYFVLYKMFQRSDSRLCTGVRIIELTVSGKDRGNGREVWLSLERLLKDTVNHDFFNERAYLLSAGVLS